MRPYRTLHHGKSRTPGENSTIVSVKAQNFLSFLHFCYFNGLILSRIQQQTIMEGDIWANFGSVATNSQVKIFF